jgi:hypothetical protein
MLARIAVEIAPLGLGVADQGAPMSQARALSPDDVRGLREELTAGGTPTVWFTPAAVGVPEGRSGKVIALDDPAEGDFIQVRPAGSKDVLSFSAGEVTVVKPPRKRKAPEAEAPTASAKPAPSEAGATTTAPAPPTKRNEEAPKAPTAGTAKSSDTTGPGASASPGARRKPRQPSTGTATLTVSAGPEGQWSVEVSTGKKRVLRPTSVPASAVAQAAKALHDDVSEAVRPLIEAAREQQRSRVEQLQQELADAQRMLDELTE